ncbi:MAG: UDP-N-acetylmuramoyl-tripeptide--D-alanyl-D-alanine ligase [Patescibacteria group bacterium]
MKPQAKYLLERILKYLAKATLWRYRPAIVGITGSVGKTSTKEAIGAVLKSERKVRVASKNFNNEIGLPLTILSSETAITGAGFWVRVILRAIWNIIRKTDYPEILVLEFGIDRPGDMRYLLEIARPNVGVVTAIGEIPVHVEYFSGPEEVAREKARLIEQLPAGGFAILNYDSHIVMGLKDRTRAHRMSYGFHRDAEVRISNFATRIEEGNPVGTSFKLEYAGNFVPVRLDHVFGRAQAYAAAAGASVGLIFGLNLVTISEALKDYRPPEHRFQLLRGLKDTIVIDDAYNASPLSVHAALDTLKDLEGKRKIAILGDMREIGSFAAEAHQDIGRVAGEIADILVGIGPNARHIADGAIETGLSKKNIRLFETADQAILSIQELIKKGDIILVKASHSIGLEKVVESIKA